LRKTYHHNKIVPGTPLQHVSELGVATCDASQSSLALSQLFWTYRRTRLYPTSVLVYHHVSITRVPELSTY